MMRIPLSIAIAVLFLSCDRSDGETADSSGTHIDIIGLASTVEEITATSVALQYTYTDVLTDGGSPNTEIWYKKLEDNEWSILEVVLENETALQIEGLDRATSYLVKPVFRVNDFIREGSEIAFTTLPINYTFVREGNPNSVWVTNIFADDDYTEVGSVLTSFLKKDNDSIPLQISVVSKDSLLLFPAIGLHTLFDPLPNYQERLEVSVTLQLNDYYMDNFGTLELYNPIPRIETFSFQKVVDCDNSDKTKLLFQGLFWDASLRATIDFNKPDDYRIRIQNVENTALATPIYGQMEERSDPTLDVDAFLSNNCEEGFTIVEDAPVRNIFHRGSFLWISFPTQLLPEGSYELQFGLLKDGELLEAEPFGFELRY